MSIKEEEMDRAMSKIFETLNLNSSSTEMHNLPLNELKSSLASLGQFVIVGKFDGDQERDDEECLEPTTESNGAATKDEEEDVETTEAISQNTKKYHDEKIFNLSCRCLECWKHRETVIQLYLEDAKYNQLWERLQKHLLTFYDIIPQSPDSAVFKKYKELMEGSQTRWLSDGSIDLKNNFRLSLDAYLPITDEIIFTLLCNRDPHQLFELICIQMQAVVLAYTEGLTNIMKYNVQKEDVVYCPSDLLNYIFDGYAKICHCEKMLSTIFFDLEAGHLLQFNVSLSQVYKRMYHRWIYLELQKLVPECILKLKESVVIQDNYTTLVQKFIKFEDAMTQVTQTWRDIWLLIQNYHKSKEDIGRRKRINTVHSIFQAIKDSDFDFDPDFVLEDKPLIDWVTSEKRNDVWQYVVHNIKHNWTPSAHLRLMAKLVNVNCTKCNSPFVPHLVTCDCRTCIIAGGPSFVKAKENVKSSMCTKCIFFEKFTNGVVVKRAAETGNEKSSKHELELVNQSGNSDRKLYHLSWAIFKHMPERVSYYGSTLDPMVFCVFQDIPCTRFSCRVAANIITLTYPINFSKYLVKHYRQLDEATRKKIMSLQMDVSTMKNWDSRTCDIFSGNKKLHPLHVTDHKWASNGDLSRDDEVPIKKASALAEGFLVDFPMPQKNVIFSYFFKLFRIVGNDIEFNVDQLDSMKKPNSKFMSSVEASSAKNRGGEQLEDINVRMNNLKIMNKVVRHEKRDSCSNLECDGKKTTCGIIDGEIKKPLVEALQLAANNKKLEAELRSLQQEHSMLKDMVRDLEYIHEEKHQCNHSADESSDSRESKSSHRTEGQCICYYCTIFGNDCSHNSRANETRDRLRRKRLRKMQANGKEQKLVTLKDLQKARSVNTIKKNVTKIASETAPKGKRMLYPKQVPTQQQQIPKMTHIPPTPVDEFVSVQKITPINCAPVDDILKFIEGDAAKKEKEALAAKKAAKKKQKQRKHEQKKIQELEELKSQYEELYTEETEVKKSLKLLKKRKNKTRLMQAEERLVEMNEMKQELITAASDIIQSLRKTNPNFHFDFGDEEIPIETNIEPMPQTPIKQLQPQLQQQPQTPSSEQRNCEISVDPSKRMVTIRRINLPHSEPQVTVTAKGASPDKDQLLYTFINGQLVPASTANPQLLQKIRNQASQCTQSNYVKPNPQLTVPPPPTKPPIDKTPQEKPSNKNAKKPNAIQMQKIQQQIQKQQQKAVEKEEKKNSNKNNEKTMQQQNNASKNKKNGKNTDKSDSNKNTEKSVIQENVSKASKTKENSKKENKEQQQEKTSSKSNKKSNKQQLNNRDKRQSSVESPPPEETTSDIKNENVSSNNNKKEKPKRIMSYIDPEFDNNAFKLLNIDDSESDADSSSNISVSSEELTTVINNKVRTEKHPPAPNQQKTSQNKDKKEKEVVQTNNNNNRNERKQSTDSSTSLKSRQKNQASLQLTQNGKESNNKGKSQKQNVKTTHDVPNLQGTKGRDATKVNNNMYNSDNTMGVSIMEQLSRGVRVEGLSLPPGITLTRIDPATCENIKAKKESICKITQPMVHVAENDHQMLPPQGFTDSSYLMVNPSTYGVPKQDNIIMVETPQLVTGKSGVMQNGSNTNETSSKNRRRRKKKKGDDPQPSSNGNGLQQRKQQQPTTHQKGQNRSEKTSSENISNNMVTLKNPMFDTQSKIMKQPTAIGSRPPMSYDQPAAIIKNENGMFTIRNPALHQAISHGQVNTLPHYSTTYGNMNTGVPKTASVEDAFYTSDAMSDGRKCNSVIGSEIKTAHQIKQAQQKEQQHWTGGCGDTSAMFGLPNAGYGNGAGVVPPSNMNKCYSPFEPSNTGGFNSDFVGRIGKGYNENYFARPHFSPRNNFSPELAHSSYYENANSKYDDTNFLQSLQPGQRLNSEVTIHNINEAKFLRDQHAESNGIEITRIQTPGSMEVNADQSHGERITLNELLKNTSLYQNKQLLDMAGDPSDYSDNIFGSNTRTSESPFNNHFYDTSMKQPQSKSAMGCLNRAPGSKSHTTTTTKSSDSPSSSLFGEFPSSLSMSSSNTPPSTDDPLVDFGSNSDPIFYDTHKNGSHGLGVIGGEIKAVHANID